MCGIAGILNKEKEHSCSDNELLAMIKTIAHRGPDIQKTWHAAGVGLAHARLSIIDLDASADQPMIDKTTGNVIVFNGEIYNYLELKQDLIQLGHTFETKSDTEVILKAYAQWGIECLNKFNGMWAFALYDQRQKNLFCARDRLGIKPFCYGITPEGTLIFASEAKAITAHFPYFNQPNTSFLLNFIEKDFFACYKETFYKHITNLLPGHYFIIAHGEQPIQKRYWAWTPQANTTHTNDKDIVEHFKYLLTDSIKLRFRSDVPVGACLSGGLDSGTIVGLSSQLFDKPIHTFSCIYPNTPQFDESAYIQSSVNKFNTIPKFTEPTHDDFIHLVHTSINEQDGPTGGPSILSQRAVMELASKDVKVLLDGQGADELLGGYHGYFNTSLCSHARHFRQKKSFSSLKAYFSASSEIKKRTGAKRSFLSDLTAIRNTQFPVSFYTENRSDTQLHYMDTFEQDDLNTMLLEHVFTNLTNLLHYEDRNSMRFSIESRLPFLDYRIVEFAFSLSHHYKIRGSTTKWLLNQVAKDVLPLDVLNRKDKMGFTTPAHQWFLADENLSYFERYLTKGNTLYEQISPGMREHFDRSFKILKQCKYTTPSSSGDINGLWRFFTASIWLDTMP